MSELQIGLLAIGVLVVGGVLAYNRFQERRARREAEHAFGPGHDDVLLGTPGRPLEASQPTPSPTPPQFEAPPAPALESHPDPAVDYVVEFVASEPGLPSTLRAQWGAIERRHAHRTLLALAPDGRTWRAGLQLVSRDGAVGEADLIEFRAAVETLAAAVGATVSAPEMRAAVEAARELDAFCAETDIQLVVHLRGGPFAGAKVQAAAEAAGLALEPDGKFALRNDERLLAYTLAASDGTALSAAALRDAAIDGLTLALDVGRAPDTRRTFESMARLAHQLAAALGATIVDDNGNALDERAVAAIAQQLEAVSARLEARGIRAGSATALRLFS